MRVVEESEALYDPPPCVEFPCHLLSAHLEACLVPMGSAPRMRHPVTAALAALMSDAIYMRI